MRRVKGWMSLRVEAIIDETHDTKTYQLVDSDSGGRAFDYYPGQYLTFRFDHIDKKALARSYTMSSSPCQPDFVAITVKRVKGGLVSNFMLDHLKVGSRLKARGPIGRFCIPLALPIDHLAMVGAGSGVTPFVSIIRECAPRLGMPGYPKSMSLLVAYRSLKDLICWQELKSLQSDQVKIVAALTREAAEGFLSGRPDPKMLQDVVGTDWSRYTLMTCGPEEFMEMVCGYAEKMGLASTHIHRESFF